MDQTTRREFLKQSAALGAAAGAMGAPRFVFGADADGPNLPTLVTVYLRGGADSLQTIIPYADPMYYDIRPTIAIAQPGRDAKSALPLDNMFGFHPAMKPLYELFQQGMVAPILNVGSPHDTRSHFDAQDFMERAAPGVKTITEGWLNRYLQTSKQGKDSELRALAFQPLLPRSLRGQYPVLAVPDDSTQNLSEAFEGMYTCEEKELKARQKSVMPPAYTGRKFANKVPERQAITPDETRVTIVNAGGNEIRRLRELREIVNNSQTGSYPGSNFGRQMKKIATVIRANRGLEVAAVDYEGWDHHAYQGGAEGTMANMLGDVSASIRAFTDDLGPDHMKKTLVLVMSEFGRTAKENGSHGSDHGRGGFMLAIGGMIKPQKKVYGQWTGLEPAQLADRRDMPVTTDFRLVFAETLMMLFGYDAMEKKFFPEFRPRSQALMFMNRITA
jgi:uncharacterized protein (DUF1501 family)